jgi:hypothetical protein
MELLVAWSGSVNIERNNPTKQSMHQLVVEEVKSKERQGRSKKKAGKVVDTHLVKWRQAFDPGTEVASSEQQLGGFLQFDVLARRMVHTAKATTPWLRATALTPNRSNRLISSLSHHNYAAASHDCVALATRNAIIQAEHS